jgi:ketosteroid isomerase-like protein
MKPEFFMGDDALTAPSNLLRNHWGYPLMLVVALLALLTGTASAKIVKQGGPQGDVSDVDAVFEAIAMAWENADEDALAKLVHQDGLRVTSGEYDRFTNYSPSQAFYYFRNQFRIHPTASFTLERLQERMTGQDRVHGMVVWEYRRSNSSTSEEMRLVLVLTRQGDEWRLSEINSITKR